MLRNRRAADRQLVRNLTDRTRALAQLLEDRPPGAVTERIHPVLVSHDLQ